MSEEAEKLKDLLIEITRIGQLKEEIVPILVGAKGSVTDNHSKHIQKILGTITT